MNNKSLIGASFMAAFALLSVTGCGGEKTEKKTVKKVAKSKKSKSSKSGAKMIAYGPTLFEDIDEDVAFNDANSLEERALAAEHEIEQLIAMLEAENERLQYDSSTFDNSFQAVFYDQDAAQVGKDQHGVVAHNVEKAVQAADAGHQLVVRGHASPSECDGNQVESFKLAQARAERMKDELLAAGVAPEQLQVASLGSTEQLVWSPDNHGTDIDSDRDVYNRRVEILTA